MCEIASLLRELETERNILHLLLTQTEQSDTEKRKSEILEQSRKIDEILVRMMEFKGKGTAPSQRMDIHS